MGAPGPGGSPYFDSMPMLPLRSAPKPPPAPRPEISAPFDGRKLAPGPNQLAGLLGKVPEKTKGQVLDLQNRPAAFHQGSQPTRQLAGRDVSISAPFLGAPIPKGNEYTLPGKSGGGSAKSGAAPAKGGAAPSKGGTPASSKEGGASAKSGQQDLSSLEGPPTTQALVRRESGASSASILEIPDFPAPTAHGLPRRGSFDLSSDAGGHDPSIPTRKENKETPFRMTNIPEHIPTPQNALARIEPKPAGRPDAGTPDSPTLPPRPSLHRQDTRPHVDPGLENLHFSQPDHVGAPPPKYSDRPPEGHKTTEVGPGVPGALDAAEEGEKKMSLGKKMMLGAGGLVALLGATFLMSTPTPPPPPEKST